jgi:archaellum component FlaC
MKHSTTGQFNSDVNPLEPVHTGRTSRASSHRLADGMDSMSNERHRLQSHDDQQYLMPTSMSVNPAVTSRVDLLLSDQKRLERDIDEQMQRLKHDYDEIRSQIHRKQATIRNEVRNISERLDEDITEHYQRKQKIYANLAADANLVGSQLERLRSNTDTNKQQLWASLEQIESNMRNIRQVIEQQVELRGALTFAEGRRAIAADTIGQLTYAQNVPYRQHSSSISPLPTSSSFVHERLSTHISPYKYIKIDHLATLEPEAIAITEHDKKILLGICNKLFILNEYGDTLKVIPLSPSIRGIAVSKIARLQHIAYVSHDETVSMIDINTGESIDSVKG